MKRRISPIWKSASMQFERGREWLTRTRDPMDWKTVCASVGSLKPKSIASRALVVVALIVVLVVAVPWLWSWYALKEVSPKDGTTVYPRASLLNPIFAGAGAVLLIYAAIRQARTANSRHNEQTDADRQRRITESFSKAVEQLASEKTEMRLGGIYALERISRESSGEYWTVMETLTAFVRERSRREAPDSVADARVVESNSRLRDRSRKYEPPTDVAAVMAVIVRRPETERIRETKENWYLNLSGADLRGTNLVDGHFEYADLWGTHLERANLQRAHLEGAHLQGAHLEGANLRVANLNGADLVEAHLEGAGLQGAHLEGAHLQGAHLEGARLRVAYLQRANLQSAHLEGAYLVGAQVEGVDFSKATGDARTQLPDGVRRPDHWQPYLAPDETGSDPAT